MPNTLTDPVEYAYVTDPGLEPTKQVNEDIGDLQHGEYGVLAVVCDGMGGHADGQQASRTALSTILDTMQSLEGQGAPPGARLVRAIELACNAVYVGGGPPELEGRPGSTCVAVLLDQGQATVAHVGDSRAYLLRNQQIRRLTRDHSIVQGMIDAGLLTEEQAKEHPDSNRITRALGMAPEVDVELIDSPLPTRAGDMFLLCTDGLTDLVSDSEIASIVSNRVPEGLQAASQALVDMAKLRGGHDNVTVLLARVRMGGAAPTLLEENAAPLAPSPPTQASREAHPATQKSLEGMLPPGWQGGASVPQPPESGPQYITEPGLAPSQFGATLREGQPASQFSEQRVSRPSPTTSTGKILVFVAAGFTLFLLGLVALWWILRALGT